MTAVGSDSAVRTEPVLRVYAEAPDDDRVQALLGFGESVAQAVYQNSKTEFLAETRFLIIESVRQFRYTSANRPIIRAVCRTPV